jgi:hypothetical protein
MIERNETGIMFSGQDLLSPNGRLILELHQELMAMTLDRDWWRNAAIGKFWDDALEDDPF